jgi:aminopeptidase N
MENPGAITFNDTAYIFKSKVTLEQYSRRCQTIVHELAHMWFGNLVTMDWWDGLWLNESFADCAALYALKELKLSFQISDFGIMQNIRKGWGYVDDQKITTHPIQTTVANTE